MEKVDMFPEKNFLKPLSWFLLSLNIFLIIPLPAQAASIAVIEGVSGQCIRDAMIIATSEPEKYMIVNQAAYDDSGSLAVCTPADKAALEGKIVPLSEEVATELEAIAKKMAESGCGVWNIKACVTDWFNKFITFVAYVPTVLGASILIIIGQLFNFLLEHTIVNFKTTMLSTGAESAINIGWTVFRDISNIVIIGMFTFIAISLILGIKEYGERKMIARVLVIAVLINFSLLFTKIIIDASNFTAFQFYKAASLQTGTADDTITPGSDTVEGGIAGTFLQFMGITSIGDVYKTLYTYQTSPGGSPGITILFGFLAGVFFIAVALVLLYGCFLLFARALLLLFLMITAPLAFASWLIPKFSSEGWHKWWDSLLKNAVFAPLLMVLLWMSLLVASKFKAGEGATLGELITNPGGKGFGTEALFSYLIILGMLFLSIKLASKFSGTISGFGVAMTAAVAPFTLGSRLAGGLLRGSVGAGAYFASGRRIKDAGSFRDEAAKAEIEAKRLEGLGFHKLAKDKRLEAMKLQESAASKLKSASRWSTVAKSKFNVMNAKPAQNLVGALGVTGFATGASSKGVKSYAEQVETRAKDAEKLAAKAAPSSDKNDEARRAEESRVRDERARDRENKLIARESAEKNVVAIERLANAQKASLEKDHDEARQDLTTKQGSSRANQDQYKQELNTLLQQVGGNENNDQVVALKARRAEALQAEEANIERARVAVRRIQSDIKDVDSRKFKVTLDDGTELESSLNETAGNLAEKTRDLNKYNKETEDLAKEAGNDIVKAMRDSAISISEKVGEQQGDILTRAIGTVTRQNKAVADETKDLYKKKRGASGRLESALKDLQGAEGPEKKDSQ